MPSTDPVFRTRSTGRGRSGEAPPVFHLALRLDGERCLVVGGGDVAARKAAALLESGAVVTVVAPEISRALEAVRDGLHGRVSIERRRYRAGEASAYGLVVTATGRPAVDEAVYLDCRRAGVLVNAVDDPQSCSFFVPAVLRRGPVSVAVSTGGVSPWLAVWLRERIGAVLGPEVGVLTEIVGLARSKVREAGHSSDRLDWGDLVDETLWPLVSAGRADEARAAADRWVASVLAGGGGGDGADAGGLPGGAAGVGGAPGGSPAAGGLSTARE